MANSKSFLRKGIDAAWRVPVKDRQGSVRGGPEAELTELALLVWQGDHMVDMGGVMLHPVLIDWHVQLLLERYRAA